GLTPHQLWQLSKDAKAKRDYLYQATNGETRLLRLPLEGAALAICGASSVHDQERARELLEAGVERGERFTLAWLAETDGARRAGRRRREARHPLGRRGAGRPGGRVPAGAGGGVHRRLLPRGDPDLPADLRQPDPGGADAAPGTAGRRHAGRDAGQGGGGRG